MPDVKSGLSKFSQAGSNNVAEPLTSDELVNNSDPQTSQPKSGLSKFKGVAPAIQNPASSDVQQVAFNATAPEFVQTSNPNRNLTKVNQLNALSQSKFEQANNALKQFVYNFGAGVSDGIAQWDLKGTADMLNGVERDYDNMFHKIAQDLRAKANDNRVYEYDPGSVSPGDFSWWANQF